MKKSYDYFKTLNILSETVSVIYNETLSKDDYEAKRFLFLAEKSELINNLRNEFITPLERGDIFLLTEYLSDELDSIFILQDYFNLISLKDFGGFNVISKSFKTQNIIFSQLKNFNGNLKLFEQCSEEIKKLNSEKKNIEKLVVDILSCKSEQPLIKYAIASLLLELNRKIYKTILLIERILIDNS